jgi:hypothetical protein
MARMRDAKLSSFKTWCARTHTGNKHQGRHVWEEEDRRRHTGRLRLQLGCSDLCRTATLQWKQEKEKEKEAGPSRLVSYGRGEGGGGSSDVAFWLRCTHGKRGKAHCKREKRTNERKEKKTAKTFSLLIKWRGKTIESDQNLVRARAMASPEPPSSPPVLAAPAPLVNICSADPFDPSPYLFSCWRNNIMTDCTVVVDQGEHRVHAHQVRTFIHGTCGAISCFSYPYFVYKPFAAQNTLCNSFLISVEAVFLTCYLPAAVRPFRGQSRPQAHSPLQRRPLQRPPHPYSRRHQQKNASALFKVYIHWRNA